MTRDRVVNILNTNEILPKKIFGQNFLCNDELCEMIADETLEDRGGPVLEIGPGIGAVTEHLADKSSDVTAIEIDKELASYLTDSLDNRARIICSDYLKLSSTDYEAERYMSAVSNIPYYVTTPIIIKMITELVNARTIVYMVEKAALDRILATPGSKQYGPLSVLVSLFGSCRVLTNVGPESFYPAPHTVSSVIKLTADPNKRDLDQEFASFLEACFSQRRKKLTNSLKVYSTERGLTGLNDLLDAIGLGTDVRAEDIVPTGFMDLYLSWAHK